MKIEVVGVGKRYGDVVALGRVDLEIAHGERVALVGSNGSGKSTLLRILMGMLTHTGTVRLDGRSPFHEREQIAQGLAYVPQAPPELGATVRDIVAAVVALRRVELGAVAATAERLGLGLDAVRDRPFRALSGGMKQKALLALALTGAPSLIVLDEPTASLDAPTREVLFELLDATPATVLLCSHRADDLQRLAERVIELHEGHVARDLRRVPAKTAEVVPIRSEEA